MAKHPALTLFLYILVFASLSGCSAAFQDEALSLDVPGRSISGQAMMYSSAMSSASLSVNSLCSSASATLHAIDAQGQVNPIAIATSALDSQSKFEFKNVKKLNVTIGLNVNYMIRVEGCGDSYSRPLTQLKKQDIYISTSLLEKISESLFGKKISDIEVLKMSEAVKILSQIPGSDLDTVYANLDLNATLKADFEAALGIDSVKLKDSFPEVKILTLPLTPFEGQANSYSISATHWFAAYNLAYVWKLNGQVVSNSSTYVLSTGKNSQGAYELELYTGQNASSMVDLTKPYFYKKYDLTMQNNILPMAPSASLVSSSITNSTGITFQINTGTAMANCESFSIMGLNENDILAPNTAAFNLNCANPNFQNLNYTLGLGDGTKTLRLWTKDSSGQISATPTALNVTLDQTSPQLILNSVAGYVKNASTVPITFSAGDATSGIERVDIYYAGDGLNYSLVQNNITTPYAWTVVSSETTLGVIKLIATDRAGNTTEVVSNSIIVDNTVPNLNLTSFSGGIYQGGTSHPITWTVSDAYLKTNSIKLEYNCGAGWMLIADEVSTSATPYVWTTPLSDASCHLRISASDLSGNTTLRTSSSPFDIDSTAPTVTLTSMNGNEFFKAGQVQGISWTVSDAHLAGNPINIEYTVNGSTWIPIVSNLRGNGGSAIGTMSSGTSSGSFTWVLPSVDSANVRVRVTAKDVLNQSRSAQSSSVFTIESQLPIVQAFAINEGNSFTNSVNVPLRIQASSGGLTPIEKFCIKKVLNKPVENDSCWVNFSNYGASPAVNIDTNEILFNLGRMSSSFTLYAWVMTQAKNISEFGDSTGKYGADKDDITFQAPPPPQILSFTSYSSANPSRPVQAKENQVFDGSPIFVQWKIQSDVDLKPYRFVIDLTYDDMTYESHPDIIEVNPTVNGGCVLTDDNTGCAVIQSHSNSYFRLRLKIEDEEGRNLAVSVSNPINSGNVMFLAGNTHLGLGASVHSAVLRPIKSPHSLAVLNDGRIFLLDERGLAWVNPDSGSYEIIFPTTGNPTGDDENPLSPTLGDPTGLHVDGNQNLILVDGVRLRYINTKEVPMKIERLLGYGNNSLDVEVSAGEFSTGGSKIGSVYVVPQGHIWFNDKDSFTSLNNNRLRRYDPVTDIVITKKLYGEGNSAISITPENGACRSEDFFITFDESYAVDQMVWKVGSTFNKLTGELGNCPVGRSQEWRALASVNLESGETFMPAPSTIIDKASSQGFDSGYREYQSYRLAPSGDIFAYAHGDGVANGIFKYDKGSKAWALVAGTKSPGTCADATNADACAISASAVSVNAQGLIFYVDAKSSTIRMIDKNNLVRTLAGAPLGSPNGISPLLARFVNIGDVKYANAESEDRIIVHDAGDKRIRDFAMGGLTLETRAGNQTCGLIDLEIDAFNQPLSECSDFVPSRLQVEIDKSRIFFSTGPNRLSALEGNTWQNLSNGFVDGPNVIAIKDSHILLGHNGPNGMGYLSTYNLNNPSVTDILFDSNITSPIAMNENFCIENVSLNSCSPWFTLGNMHGQYDAVTDQWIIPDQTQGRVVAIDASGNGPIRTFATFERPARDIALDRSLDLTSNLIYYCAENGELHKLDLTTMSEVRMSFPITGMKCNGQIQLLKQRNTLLFSYIQNGLQGVAEYILP